MMKWEKNEKPSLDWIKDNDDDVSEQNVDYLVRILYFIPKGQDINVKFFNENDTG